MSDSYPAKVYRRPSGKTLSQGDIAYGEFCQLRARSGDRPAPGTQDFVNNRLPFLGDYSDFKVEVPVGDRIEERVLRVWQGFVMVVHQNCEITYQEPTDSRLQVAPIVSADNWPEADWDHLRTNQVPGYLYLPDVGPDEAGDLGLSEPWPESAVVFASACSSSIGLVKPRRLLSLSAEMLPHLQDGLVRYLAARGFADFPALEALKSKRIVSVRESDVTVPGPAKIVKVYFGDNESEVDEGDDEGSFVYFGVRP